MEKKKFVRWLIKNKIFTFKWVVHFQCCQMSNRDFEKTQNLGLPFLCRKKIFIDCSNPFYPYTCLNLLVHNDAMSLPKWTGQHQWYNKILPQYNIDFLLLRVQEQAVVLELYFPDEISHIHCAPDFKYIVCTENYFCNGLYYNRWRTEKRDSFFVRVIISYCLRTDITRM